MPRKALGFNDPGPFSCPQIFVDTVCADCYTVGMKKHKFNKKTEPVRVYLSDKKKIESLRDQRKKREPNSTRADVVSDLLKDKEARK